MFSWGRGRRARRLAGALALMLAPIGFVAQASAATIAVAKRCYVNPVSGPTSMTVQGSGFTPGDQILITSSDGSVDTTAAATASGTITASMHAPSPPFTAPGEKTVTLTATDFPLAGPALTATTPVTVAPLLAATKPREARFTSKVTWFFSGFDTGKYIYAHYLRKRQVALARFGRAAGPCGLLTVRARLYPGGHPRFRSYGVQIDDSRRYDKNASPKLVTRLGSRVV